MRSITRRFLEEAKRTQAKTRAPLDHWFRIVRAAQWNNFGQTRQTFAHADQVTAPSGRTVTVFNITNDLRLVTAIHYNRQEVFTMRCLSHTECRKNTWLA